jgi:hypothetical protein
MRAIVVALAVLASALLVLPAGAETAATGTAAATAAGKPDLSVPRDESTTWTVGFTVLASDGLSTENRYLANSLPLLLKDEVSGLLSHTYSPGETESLQRLIIARQIAMNEQALTNARKERDALFFGEAPPAPEAVKGIEQKLKAIVERGDFLRTLDPSLIAVAKEKPVTIKSADESGKLLDTPKVPARQYCEAQSLDLLIGGSLQEVQGYLLCDLWVYSAAGRDIIFTARDAALRADLYSGASELGRGIAEAILGREWTLVRFSPNPPYSSLMVDGALVASGAAPALYLVPGRHEVKIQAPGHAPAERTVTLEPGAATAIDDVLEKTVTGSISVNSVPGGADFYLDSIWIGKTPLLFDRPSGRSRGVLSLDGYYDLPFAILPESGPVLSYALQQDLGSRDAQQKAAREDFYTSFAWFALSLPLPVFAYALAIDFASQQVAFLNASDSARASAAETTSNVFRVGYYGGIAVSASLFVWMVFRIITYVTISSGTAG